VPGHFPGQIDDRPEEPTDASTFQQGLPPDEKRHYTQGRIARMLCGTPH
jgi:hypothetical protein